MKLINELVRLMSDYYALNKLGLKMLYPSSQEYMKLLKSDTLESFLNPYGYLVGDEIEYVDLEGVKRLRPKTLDEELAVVPRELMSKVDITVKGAVFLYLNEILSWNEVKVLLNIDTSGVILFKDDVGDSLGAYDIVISLLAVLFGKVTYDDTVASEYNFERLTEDVYYWDQPIYYYGHKLVLSYSNLDDILDNIDWFISENPDVQTLGVPNRYDILGMLRINDKFTQLIIEANDLTGEGIVTEMDDLGYYNISLNLIRISDTVFGLNNTLFDFYKSIKETTRYTEDGLISKDVDWDTIRTYSKYIDNVIDIDVNYLNIEKTGNIIRNIQNFLIN